MAKRKAAPATTTRPAPPPAKPIKPAKPNPKPSKPKLSPDDARQARAHVASAAQIRGETLTRQQSRDVAWLDRQLADTAVANWIAAVPKGDYCRLAGRQHKLIDDAARLYELPIADTSIDLTAAVTALHDIIAANAGRIRGADVDVDRDELEDEKLRQQIAKLRNENDLLQVKFAEARRDAIPRAELVAGLTAVAPRMREFAANFARMSVDAGDLFNDVCEKLADEVETGSLKF